MKFLPLGVKQPTTIYSNRLRSAVFVLPQCVFLSNKFVVLYDFSCYTGTYCPCLRIVVDVCSGVSLVLFAELTELNTNNLVERPTSKHVSLGVEL